jgi:hypothetical protein
MNPRRTIQVAALLALAVVLLTSVGQPVLANGEGVEVFRATDGSYELIVRVQPDVPSVGAVHVTFEPRRAGTAEPVVDAAITVVARDEAGADRYIVRALNTPREERYYDANLTFDSPGDWTLVAEIESSTIGRATFLVPLAVQEQSLPPRSFAGTVAWLLVTGIIVGGVVYLSFRSRQALKGRRRTG